MPKFKNKPTEIGNAGESLANAHLLKQGYQILERNWRFKKLEVDIIAAKDDLVVFVEVKTRKNCTFGEPHIFVSKQKQTFIIKAAQYYLEKNNIIKESRFDIISIVYQNQQFQLEHLEGAFNALH